MQQNTLSRRAYFHRTEAKTWNEIWETSPYYERLSEVLEQAQDSVIFVGWQIDSRLPLGSESLKQKILRLCDKNPNLHFYFLIWAHVPIYALEREHWQRSIWKDIHPRVHFVFDNLHFIGSSHHEKICIVDGKRAFCGGIDICGDRWDTNQHRFHDSRRSLDGKQETHGPYHDLAVELTGPVCAELHEHVAQRWRAATTLPFPPSPQPHLTSKEDSTPGHTVYFSRTYVDPSHSTLIREIEFLYRDLIQSARQAKSFSKANTTGRTRSTIY